MNDLVILQTHIDFKNDKTTFERALPIISIYGNTLSGIPVQVTVNDFIPYFYALPDSHIETFEFESCLSGASTKGKCLGVEKIMKQSIYGYSEEKIPFYKIFFNDPLCFRNVKEILEAGLIINGKKTKFKTFETSFPFTLRFMNDKKIDGMSYLKVSTYKTVSSSPFVISTSSEFIHQLEYEGDYRKLIPLKILSFDIECCNAESSFPTPNKDPVIQIGNTIEYFGKSTIKRDIFCLKETAPIADANVHWFQTETEMMMAWRNFLLKEDPDIIIGYNIKGFDFPYLLDRAKALKLKDYAILGRTNTPSKVINKQQSSKAFGSFDAKEINIDGRIIIDVLHIIRRDFKLRSYSLNAVSYYFLNEQKEDVPHTSMYSLHKESPESRKRIATYCLKDTYLPLRIFDKLNILVNLTELARATHVPLEYFLTRGSSIKVLSQIYREASELGYVIPDIDIGDTDESFEGAFVIDPMRGYYSSPIAVLDFSSLYPSIIINKNLCYTTLLNKSTYDKIGGVQTPTNNYFCSKEKKEGLVPRILNNLLKARKETKRLIKETDDPLLKRSLDARQYALKICANSIYGFTGAKVGQLPCIEISQSTTSFGREIISMAKRLIEDNFNKKNNYDFDSVVIYGDTDSVMINLNIQDLERVFEMAKKISAFVTSKFEAPISLEFEKVYYPYLIMNKKRYAGLVYTNPHSPDKIDSKGIETVRRDNCELVRNTVQICLNKLLFDKDVEAAKKYAKEVIRDLYLERVDLSKLVISKTYTKANYTSKQPHVELVERLKKRGINVGIGDRIEYVIVKGDKKMLASEKSEDPVYVLDNNIPIDTEYYIEQQLSKPLQRIFEPIMSDVSSLFSGEHTKVRSISVGVKGPMNAFVSTLDECLNCKKAGKIVCDNCRGLFTKIYSDYMNTFNSKTEVYNECWTECQRCQGSVINEVLCVNRICPIWYKRTKIKTELKSLCVKIEKLRNLKW